MGKVFVSIIIPTYHDWYRLWKCLRALAEQTYGSDMFEIIIVNNDPLDALPGNVIIPQNAKILSEEKVGSYACRNTGIRNSKGSILGFTDSDCIPDKYWIQHAVHTFQKDNKIRRVWGKIELFFAQKKPNIFELYEKIYAFKQEEKCQQGYCVTANLFTYREVFDAVWYFDERLLSGGDWDWGKRAQTADNKIFFDENVIIHHPARNTLFQLVSKTKRVTWWQLRAIQRLWSIPKVWKIKYLTKYWSGIWLCQKMLIFFIRLYLKLIAIKECLLIILFRKKEARQ